MKKEKIMKYRGVIPATIVHILEGDGTPDFPYEEVKYVIVFENVGGVQRQATIGKIVALTDEEKYNFNT